MDGNGRWGRRCGLSRQEGHRKGSESVLKTTKYCIRHGIKALTLYAFSTENRHRPQAEIDFLMELFHRFLLQERERLRKENIRLDWLGRRDFVPAKTRDLFLEMIEETAGNDRLRLTLAIDYGARDEIARAARKIVAETKKGNLSEEEITETTFANYLDTAGLPEVDLLVRTAGEKRISNFLLYQIAYAELYFTPKCWPEFDDEDFDDAVFDFSRRKRKFGRTVEA